MLTSAMAAGMLVGCSSIEVEIPKEVLETNSLSHPVRALTNFSDGLTCAGRLLKDNKVENIYVMAADIPDYSESNGAAGFGAKEMVISALSRLSEENGIVRFVAYDRRTPNIVALHNSHPKKNNLRIPDFYIRGAVTQIDSSPFSSQQGTSLSVGDGVFSDLLGAGASNSNSVTLKSVTLDLNMGLVSNYQLLPGVTSSNTLSVLKRGNSTELTVSFSKVGGIYSMNENKAGALSNALRALVEVGIIELMGKLYNVKYENCLVNLDADSVLRGEIQTAYDFMTEQEQLDLISAEMVRQGILDEGIISRIGDSIEMTVGLQQAIAAYRVRNGLFPSSVIDYRLFERAFIQSKQSIESLQSGSGVGPLDRWLHADKNDSSS